MSADESTDSGNNAAGSVDDWYSLDVMVKHTYHGWRFSKKKIKKICECAEIPIDEKLERICIPYFQNDFVFVVTLLFLYPCLWKKEFTKKIFLSFSFVLSCHCSSLLLCCYIAYQSFEKFYRLCALFNPISSHKIKREFVELKREEVEGSSETEVSDDYVKTDEKTTVSTFFKESEEVIFIIIMMILVVIITEFMLLL